MQRMSHTFAGIAIFLGLAIPTLPANLHAQGQAIFKANCVLCHAEDGSASSATGKALGAKDLRSHEVQEKTNAELMAIVTDGKDKMPTFGKKLKPAEIKQVVAYVRTLAAKKKAD